MMPPGGMGGMGGGMGGMGGGMGGPPVVGRFACHVMSDLCCLKTLCADGIYAEWYIIVMYCTLLFFSTY